MPSKHHQRGPVEFLAEDEVAALVTSPDTDTWLGRRDRTGIRSGEIIGLRRRDVELGAGAHVRCLGKGRRTRCTPLSLDTAAILRKWLEARSGEGDDHVFPTARGGRISADALQRLVARHVASASERCPSLKGKKVTPHTLRNSMAMSLLRRGVDLTVIALWLGHESTETTQIYLHADLRLKEQALAHGASNGITPERYHPSDSLLSFPEGL